MGNVNLFAKKKKNFKEALSFQAAGNLKRGRAVTCALSFQVAG